MGIFMYTSNLTAHLIKYKVWGLQQFMDMITIAFGTFFGLTVSSPVEWWVRKQNKKVPTARIRRQTPFV